MNPYEELRTRYAEILKKVEKEKTLVAHFMGDLPEIVRKRLGFPLSQIKFYDEDESPCDRVNEAMSPKQNGWQVKVAFSVCADANCKIKDVSLLTFFISVTSENSVSVDLFDGQGNIDLSTDHGDSIYLLADRIFGRIMTSYGRASLSEFVKSNEIRRLG